MKILIISFVLLVSACGMQGDLYLQEEDTKKDDVKTDEVPEQETTQKNNNSY